MGDQGIFVSKKDEISDRKNQINTCCVKNCGKIIPEGEEVKIEGNVYCSSCGTIIIKSTLGL